MSQLQSPLSKVKGLGSAKEGTSHFWVQRLTAIAMVPLILWFCFSVASLPGMTHADIHSWLASPFSAVMLILLLLTGFYHAKLGLQMVIEDYIGNHGVRTASIIGVNFACAVLAVLGVFSVLRISFGS